MKRVGSKSRRRVGARHAETADDADDVNSEPVSVPPPLSDDQRRSLARRRLEQIMESRYLESRLRDVFDEP